MGHFFEKTKGEKKMETSKIGTETRTITLTDGSRVENAVVTTYKIYAPGLEGHTVAEAEGNGKKYHLLYSEQGVEIFRENII
jgi:hypothetical protein